MTSTMNHPSRTHRETYDAVMEFGEPRRKSSHWTFLTNHAHVLIAIDRNPELRQRDIADAVGITIGAVQKIIQELEAGGYVERERVGRRNRYIVKPDHPLRHPLEEDHTVRDLLTSLDA